MSNSNWREYLSYLKDTYGESSAIYTSAFPDTAVWTTGNEKMSPFASTYFHHSSYDDYPVVGVSYDQAKAFCAWRTEAVK